MVCSVWCVAFSVYCVLCSMECVVCGVWCVVCGVSCVVCGVWCVMCSVKRTWTAQPRRSLFFSRRSDAPWRQPRGKKMVS